MDIMDIRVPGGSLLDAKPEARPVFGVVRYAKKGDTLVEYTDTKEPGYGGVFLKVRDKDGRNVWVNEAHVELVSD